MSAFLNYKFQFDQILFDFNINYYYYRRRYFDYCLQVLDLIDFNYLNHF